MYKQYVPGPSLIYAGVGGAGAYLQLGFTEQNVRVATSVKHRGVSADFAADMDADISMMGEEIMVSLRLARYNEVVLELCKKRLGTPLSTAPGSGAAGALGALLGLEGNTYPLAIISSYSTKTVFSDMVPGILIPKAYMAGSTEVELGTRIKVPVVTFSGLATFGLDGSYSLFSTAVGGLALPEPA